MAEGGWDVFVSYGHGDAEWVEVLAGNLHRAGFEVFLDVWELVGGDRFSGRLEEGIRGSASGVLVVSPHALSRPWVQEEYAALLGQAVGQPGRRLIPVLLVDAELPPFLATRQWVDFRGPAATGPAYDARLAELVRALRGQPVKDRPARDSAPEQSPAPGGQRVRPAGPLRATLRISPAGVTLTGEGAEPVSQRPRGLRQATAAAAADLAWRQTHPRPGAAAGEEDAALATMGRLLCEDFLAGPVGAALAGRAAAAASLNEVLELGLAVEEPGLADLPWETLVCPLPSGEVAEAGGGPLVLERNVALYRQVTDPGVAPAHKVRGPLRLLVVIASPDAGGGELLDYERELARIVAAVEPARRRDKAYVRVLSEGSLDAIADALAADPEGFHVLHLSCHARPGELILETPGGAADPVTARRLLEEGVPAGADLPMIVLSGCSTGLAARQQQPSPGDAARQVGQTFKGGTEGESALASLAAELVAAGVPQVLAMQAPVTDGYATHLAAAIYRHLASDASPDPLLALAAARREAERDRLAQPPGSPRRGPAEWAVPALLARGLRLPLFNPREPPGEIRAPEDPVLAEGVVVREVGEFVGRRAEARHARRTLAGPKAGLVIHGIGGVGKSTLAAEVLRSLGEDAGLVVSRAGPLLVDDLLSETGARLHQAADGGPLAQAGLALRAGDVEWADRWRLLAEQILPRLAMTVLLDNFEDNLQPDGDGWVVGDPELADLLARWAARPGRSRLLITSRHPFTLPGAAARRLEPLPLGPLSPAETRKLIWRLPGLDALDPAGKDRAHQDVGGHPRALEYLDALLRGQARFDDVATRMEDQLRARGIPDPAAWLAAPGRDLDTSLAETITLAASDTLLPTLLGQLAITPLAADLVIGAAVYRVPVDDTALTFQTGQPVHRPPDPARQDRLKRASQAIAETQQREPDREISLKDAGLSAEDYAQLQADLAEEFRPPYDPHEGLHAATRAARASGLLAAIPRGGASLHAVHRWTAAAIAQLHPDATFVAHQRAAAFWRWRVDKLPQSREQDIEQLLEARYHHHAAGQTDDAVAVTETAVLQLQTWGQYGRAAELIRDTLTWLPPGSKKAADFEGQLGTLAYLRGDYLAAETLYRRALVIEERLGDQAGMASSYHQLGILAQLRGDYPAAETFYRQALAIFERLDNQAGLADGYGQLGVLAQDRGDDSAAETLYRQSLAIFERLGDQAGLATSYHNLGVIAQDRGDDSAAETLYRQSLAINERLGKQSSMANNYHQLGNLAYLRGDYPAAETLYRQAIVIEERLGNQAGLATSYSALARLSEATGNPGGAVTSRLSALAIRQQIDMSADQDIRALSELRRTLGAERFRASLPPGLDEASAENLMQILHEWDSSADN